MVVSNAHLPKLCQKKDVRNMKQPKENQPIDNQLQTGRRQFLGGVVAGGAAGLAAMQTAHAAEPKPSAPSATRPTAARAAAETAVPADLGHAGPGVPGS
ncbi:MAG: hypothetical protein EB072_12035, partial [Betaproteobacteria bacterium]|nr:hypothetical protein [Betaproteobacteria bacterium]